MQEPQYVKTSCSQLQLANAIYTVEYAQMQDLEVLHMAFQHRLAEQLPAELLLQVAQLLQALAQSHQQSTVSQQLLLLRLPEFMDVLIQDLCKLPTVEADLLLMIALSSVKLLDHQLVPTLCLIAQVANAIFTTEFVPKPDQEVLPMAL
jgi:hypothetical protein